MKPILCLDFDGVIHQYKTPWKRADVIPDPPVEGAFDFILEALKQFEVYIFSSRSHQPGGKQAMVDWMVEWGFPAHALLWYSPNQLGVPPFADGQVKFPDEKPPALVTLDDRAVQFTGAFPDVSELRAFKPWNKRGV